MAKKAGKILALAALVGAAAGAYYYYKSKEDEIDDSFDDFDDFEDFEDEFEEDVTEDTLAEAKDTIRKAAEEVNSKKIGEIDGKTIEKYEFEKLEPEDSDTADKE